MKRTLGLFGILLLAIVLTGCAKTGENAAGDASLRPLREVSMIVQGDYLKLRVNETGYTSTAKCVGEQHELTVAYLTGNLTKAGVDGELTDLLHEGQTQTLKNGLEVTVQLIQNEEVRFSVDGYLTPSLSVQESHQWFETPPCEVTVVSVR